MEGFACEERPLEPGRKRDLCCIKVASMLSLPVDNASQNQRQATTGVHLLVELTSVDPAGVRSRHPALRRATARPSAARAGCGTGVAVPRGSSAGTLF